VKRKTKVWLFDRRFKWVQFKVKVKVKGEVKEKR